MKRAINIFLKTIKAICPFSYFINEGFWGFGFLVICHHVINNKLRGYQLINDDKNEVYSIVRYESPLLLKEEVA